MPQLRHKKRETLGGRDHSERSPKLENRLKENEWKPSLKEANETNLA